MTSDNAERDSMQADVVIVGAGPAGLCCAIRLAQLYQQFCQQNNSHEFSVDNIMVIEKAAEIGMHSLSGAIVDPRALLELLPEADFQSLPFDCYVNQEQLFWFTEKRAYPLPFIPKAMRNRGYPIVSLSKLTRWLADYAERLGISVVSATAATRLLNRQDAICGVKTDDKGLDREGQPKPHYEPGIELYAHVTVLAEGARGSLAKQLIRQFELDKNKDPQTFALGVKEIWEIPEGRISPGSVWHSSGYPLSKHSTGGAWLYALNHNRLSLGLITDLNFSDPTLSPHELMQQYKQHPKIRSLLEGGKFMHYGAKTLSKGGYWSLPYPVCDGCLIIGDNAGLVDSLRLKGIHLAMKSGMLAAESIFVALNTKNYSANQLRSYQQTLSNSWINKDMWTARNHHQALQYNFSKSMLHLFLQKITGGRGLTSHYRKQSTQQRLQKISTTTINVTQTKTAPDNTISFPLSTRVFHSGTKHEPEQPVHLVRSTPDICHPKCTQEYGNPCQYFCPAAVYEVTIDKNHDQQLQINAANCLHCKTCDIMDPYQIIDWRPPEGGGGPQYESM